MARRRRGRASVPYPSSDRSPPVSRLTRSVIRSDVIQLSADQVPPDTYALRVRGKSMIEDLIDDGDLVVVEPTPTARDGEIVVALLTDGPNAEGAATLKRFYHEGDRIRLQPAHPTMEPIYADPQHVLLQGRAISIIRHLH